MTVGFSVHGKTTKLADKAERGERGKPVKPLLGISRERKFALPWANKDIETLGSVFNTRDNMRKCWQQRLLLGRESHPCALWHKGLLQGTQTMLIAVLALTEQLQGELSQLLLQRHDSSLQAANRLSKLLLFW